MDNQAKEYIVHALRKEFITFMQGISKIPGSHVQKQQAFLRFDEGHMWMQNAILSYVPPQAPIEPPTVPEDQPIDEPEASQESVNLTPDEVQALSESTLDPLAVPTIQPEGQPEVSPAE